MFSLRVQRLGKCRFTVGAKADGKSKCANKEVSDEGKERKEGELDGAEDAVERNGINLQ